MKNNARLFLGLAGLILATGTAYTATVEPDVEVGETIPAVIAKIGEPEGQFQQGKHLIFYYGRGMVDFSDGRVVKSSLVSSEEARQIRQERERIEADQRRRAEAEQKRLTRDGAVELKKKVEDKAFAAQPATTRLAAWQEFSRRYPFTDVGVHLAAAQKEVDQLNRARQAQAEIPQLKKRLSEIQARFTQLDQDYATSLAHWKRNEITAERTRLSTEQAELESRLRSLEPTAKP